MTWPALDDKLLADAAATYNFKLGIPTPLAITPDGPRGPRYQVQAGVIALAQFTGLPLVPVSCHLSAKKVLRSWDGFQVALPFGRCAVEIGEPLMVPRRLDAAEREQLRAELERRLRAITRD